MCIMQSDVSSELGAIHGVIWKVMSRFMGEVNEHTLMGEKPQVEQRGNKTPVSIHKNKQNMFCPAQIQVVSCLVVPEVLKSPRGVDDTHVRFCICLIWELDSQSGIVCHINKITTNLQWSLCVVGCFYVSCCHLSHHRFHWFRKSYLVVFHSLVR